MASVQKHIERRIRRAFIGSLALLRARGDGASEPTPSEAPRILLIRHDRIGDALISTPVMTLLRERFPHGRIDVLLGGKNGAAAAILPAVDGRLVMGGARETSLGVIRRMRRSRYDVAINLLAKDSASGALLTGLSAARFKIGFAGATANVYDAVIEKPAEPMHIVRETSLLLAPFGIPPIGERPNREAERLSVVIPEEARARAARVMREINAPDDGPMVALNISGSGPEKFWGIEPFIRCAIQLRLAGMVPLIAAAPADRPAQEAIAAGSGCGTLPVSDSFAEFAAMLDRAAMTVTPDTSVVHLSAALGKPTVMLVGSGTTGASWSPWGVERRVISGDGRIATIAHEAVVEAALALRPATRSPFPSSTA